MNLADLSIKRPVFITSVVVLMLVAGLMFLKRLPVDLFPNVTFPIVVVSVPYPGAGPAEIETLIAKPLENEISTISGIKRLNAIAQEGVGIIVAEFNLNVDIKYAEDQIKTAVTRAKRDLPTDIGEPVTRRVDPADQPILMVSLTAKDMTDQKMFDLADQVIRPQLEQVNQVGQIQIFGGREREIHIDLDRNKLKQYDISATTVSERIKTSGSNIPLGKTVNAENEMVYRSMGQFLKLDELKDIVLNFFGNDVPVTVKDVGTVTDTMKDETSRAFVNGEKSLFVLIYKQSGSNTIGVVNSVKDRIDKINTEIGKNYNGAKLSEVRDGSKWIRNNVLDVTETILLGILLAIVVVFFFLGSGRSTLITSLALPNSLIGAFILMYLAGFSINIMTLLALTLAVGLLIDDAIVVRENIFRHLEMGKAPIKAALEGTGEVRLAVIATTLAVIAVFGPVGFLQGVVGQFFKEFGLTVCFAMMISLFDALTIAPMLSAYLASKAEHDQSNPGFIKRNLLMPFDRLQTNLENIYEKTLKWVIRKPLTTLGLSFLVFAASIASAVFVTKTFLPPQDAGEFMVSLSLPPGTSLEKMTELSKKVDDIIRSNKEIEVTALMVGTNDGESNTANSYVRLVPYRERALNTSGVKEKVREQLKDYAYATPTVKDYDAVGGGLRPFNVNIVGTDQKKLEEIALKVLEKIKKYKAISDPDINFRPGKPEFQVKFNQAKMQQLGISTAVAGNEMRTLIDGTTPAKFRETDREYDVRVRLQEDQRDLKTYFNQTDIPNINGKLVPLNRLAEPVETVGPSKVTRQNRIRYVQINGDVAPGAGFGNIITDVTRMLTVDEDTKLPEGMDFIFVGQAENFQELGQNMMIALGLGILFIYFVLASLYESFITPFTIMLALPLAISGSFFALFIAHESLNIFSWIGIIMLLGVSTKNSILLVDYANQLVRDGMTKNEALIRAGRVRLRPILMTTIALVAGMIPLAIGLNEASKQRTSMGIAAIGGLLSSTLLTLLVVPAAYSYMERFRVWSLGKMKKTFAPEDPNKALEVKHMPKENGRSHDHQI
jgi:HAE1 family hydrophobic/amphiphilic exporter-1